MRPFYSMLGTTVLALSLACARDASVPTALHPSGSAELGRGTLPIVSLTVTVEDVDPAGTSYGIRSDGKGTYVDGSQNVKAVLDQYGNFAFDIGAAKRSAPERWVIYDFGRPVDPNNTLRFTSGNDYTYHFSTGPSRYAPSVPLQQLGVGANPVSQCMYMGNGLLVGLFGQWRVSYHKGFDDTPDSPTSYAVFTRTSVSPAQWTVQPVGSCSPSSGIAGLYGTDSNNTFYGYYYVPFFFTLRAR